MIRLPNSCNFIEIQKSNEIKNFFFRTLLSCFVDFDMFPYLGPVRTYVVPTYGITELTPWIRVLNEKLIVLENRIFLPSSQRPTTGNECFPFYLSSHK
jgi:hypothetical protein